MILVTAASTTPPHIGTAPDQRRGSLPSSRRPSQTEQTDGEFRVERRSGRVEKRSAAPRLGAGAPGGPGRAQHDHGDEHERLRPRLAPRGDHPGRHGHDPGHDRLRPAVTGTITLLSALPDLTGDTILSGPGASVLTVARSAASGTPEFRIFTVDAGAR